MSQPHRTTRTTTHHNGHAAFGPSSVSQDGPGIGSAAAFLDAGLLAITTPAGALVITPDSWKSGISGTWTTGTDWSTGAAPTVSSAATIAVPGTYTVTVSSNVAANSLTLDNAAATLAEAAGGTLSLTTTLNALAGTVAVGGEIDGGTVSASSGAAFTFTGGRSVLRNVTWDGVLTVGGHGQYLNISKGLTLLGANGSGPGTLNIDATGSEYSINAVVEITDSETLDNATLALSGSGGFLETGGDGSATPGTLTLGAGFKVMQSTGMNTLWSNTYTYQGSQYVDPMVNDGSILLSGGSLYVQASYAGQVGFINNGTISVSGGTLIFFGDSVRFNATGVLRTSGTGSIYLNAQDVTGTVNADNATIYLNYTTLTDVTWEGPLTISNPYDTESNTVSVSGGLTLTGPSGSGPGTLNLSGSDYNGECYLSFQDSETLNNATLNLRGDATLEGGLNGISSTPGTLTLGSGVVVTQAAGDNDFDTVNSGAIVNDGTILATGGELAVLTYNAMAGAVLFTNNGTISASSGATIALDFMSNAQGTALIGGTFAADAGGTLILPTYGFSLINDAATIILSGSGSVIEHKNSAAGSYVTIDQSLTTIASSGSLELLAGRDFTAASGFIDNGMLQLGGGTLAATPGIAVASGGTLSGFGTVTAAVTDNGTVNAANASGQVLVLTDVSGAGTLSAAAGGKVDLVGGGTLTEIVTGAGKLQLDSGSYTLSTTLGIAVAIVEAGASLTGPGTVDGAFVNQGTVGTGTGTLTFAGNTSNVGTITATGATAIFDRIAEGAGTLAIGAAGTVSLLVGAQASQVVDFLASTGTLDVTSPLDFLGSITGFGADDIIDLINTPETSYSFSSGVLTITNGTQTEARLHFTGTYTKMDFLPGSDHHGGTQITFV